MAMRPLKPCKKPGCGVLTREAWCPQHKPQKAQRRESAQWHDWYSLDIWTKKLRPEQLMREPFCRACQALNPPVRTRATVVDHVVPHRGSWALFIDPLNHQSLCKNHHDQKTAREMNERRQK